MRVTLLFLVFVFSISSCTVNRIRVNNDSYKNERRIVLEQSYYSMSSHVPLESGVVSFKFEKVRKNGIVGKPFLSVRVNTKLGYHPDNEFFINTNGKIHKLTFKQIDGFNKVKIETISSTDSETEEVTEEEEKHNYLAYNMSANFDDDLIISILQCKKMEIRLYVNREPLTIPVTIEKIRTLQKFLLME